MEDLFKNSTIKNQKLINLIKNNNPPNLINYSAIPLQGFYFNSNMIKSASHHKKKAIGCMMGLVCGDALGAPLEFTDIKYPPFTEPIITDMQETKHFRLKPGQYTDNTSMALCITDSLIVHDNFNPFDIMLRFQAWWHCGYNNCFKYDMDHCHSIGICENILQSMTNFLYTGDLYTTSGNFETNCNGSIMRNAPICIKYWNNIEDAMKFSELQSKITHQGIEAWENARLLSWICVNLINSDCSPQTIDIILSKFKVISQNKNIISLINSEDDWNWKNEYFKYNRERTINDPKHIGSYSTDCLGMALHCIYTTNTFESAIIKAVNMCGDADTVGAVTGQIAGSLYGYDNIPIKWLQAITYWNEGSILYRSHLLYEKGYTL